MERADYLEKARAQMSEAWPSMMRGKPSQETIDAFKAFADSLWNDLIDAINEEKGEV